MASYTFSRSSDTLRPTRPPEAFAAGFVALATLRGIIPTMPERPITSGEAEHVTSALGTRCRILQSCAIQIRCAVYHSVRPQRRPVMIPICVHISGTRSFHSRSRIVTYLKVMYLPRSRAICMQSRKASEVFRDTPPQPYAISGSEIEESTSRRCTHM